MNAVDFFLCNKAPDDHPFLLGRLDACTYGDLHRRTAALRKYLDENLPANEKIILLTANSMFFIVSYLSIM